MINTTKAKTTRLGYTVRLIYQISIHTSDIKILQGLMEYFIPSAVLQRVRKVR